MNLLLSGKLDVHLFHIFVPTLEEMTGLVELNLRVEGPWKSPELFGTLSTHSATVRIRGLPHAIERIRTQAKFTRSKLNIERAEAVFAGGSTTAAGFIQFEGIGRAPMNIKINIKGMNLNVPDKVRTSGNADLLITGEEFPFLISGNYRVLGGLIERDFLSGSQKNELKQSIYLPQNLKKESLSPLSFDIQVIIENALQIRNPQAEGSLTGSLRLKGTPTNPLLLGKIQLERETLITFKDKTFNLQNGVIEFNNSSKLSPDLFISAQTRVAEYDINLMLLGSSEDPDLRLTSVPPLPLPDLLSLLALGVTPTAAQNAQSSEQARRTGFELGAVILSNNPLNRRIQDRLGVNIQLTTTLDSTKNVNVPKVIASRKLTKKVNASASRSLGGDETITEMKVQYMINKNVSAIGSYENRETTGATNLDTTEQRQKSIFGLDLEYRRDFK
jgi:translocation and assembly module TamB